MPNIFSQMKEFVKQPKRNVFDLSFQNNLTMQFGKLYPVFVKDVLPGDSFRIEPTFGLRFMPLVFPIQTKMRANLHFFYVRNRNLWKDWPDFIGRTKTGLTMPYLGQTAVRDIIRTGALGDYMGIPTTVVGNYGSTFSFDDATLLHDYTSSGNAHRQNFRVSEVIANLFPDADNETGIVDYHDVVTKDIQANYLTGTSQTVAKTRFGCYTASTPINSSMLPKLVVKVKGSWADRSDRINVLIARHNLALDTYELAATFGDVPATQISSDTYQLNLQGAIANTLSSKVYYPDSDNVWNEVSFSSYMQGYENDFQKAFEAIVSIYGTVDYKILIFGSAPYRAATSDTTYAAPHFNHQDLSNNAFIGVTELIVNTVNDGYKELADLDPLGLSRGPFSGDIRISALPFRAYESIYNAFYRNQQNDPFTINGVVEYNKYITNNDGGEDNTPYTLYRRNWELDFLTSAVQSPQQGSAPLVGVTAGGTFTFHNEDGSSFTAQATVGDDGDTITGLRIQSPDDKLQPDGNVQTGSLKALQDAILNYGISISDFRNVNALQRWLEVNMRRGFRYKDQLMSHFGVDAKYEELDMPEFIGGMSEPVMINQVNQTSEGNSENPLGSYAGQASILASSEHSINHYCDEHGFIIGIMSITPVPNYSQLLPKMLLKHDTLDFFFPEFGHIGMQPITYNEVCPLQTYYDPASGSQHLNDVFGYQRAWYDYLASVDEVHGLFRTSLRNFLINRQFDEKPELGADFLQVDPDQVNDVFAVTDTTDKILGQMYFKVTAKRPIPKFGIPRLEA